MKEIMARFGHRSSSRDREYYKRVAVICPGQGGQEVGMGLDLLREPIAKAVFTQADDVFEKNYGEKITTTMFDGPEEMLNKTSYAQPAILTDTVAHYLVGHAHGQKGLKERPAFFVGHSLGEYSAAVLAQAISLQDGVYLVSERGRAMQEACDALPTDMRPIKATVEEVKDLQKKFPQIDLGLLNTHDQLILSAPKDILDEATPWAKENLKLRIGRPLLTAGAFHSRYMEPARKHLTEVLQDIKIDDAEVPIVANMTALPIQKAEDLREEFINQLVHPVNWRGVIQYLHDEDIDHIFHVGKKDTSHKMTVALVGGVVASVVVGGVTLVAHEWKRHQE